MADVSNVNLIRSDRVENEITQTASDNYACVRFVRFSSLKWIVGQLPRTFDKTSDKTRGDIRAVLADISVNLSKVALRRPGKSELSYTMVQAIKLVHFLVRRKIAAARGVHASAYCGSLFVRQPVDADAIRFRERPRRVLPDPLPARTEPAPTMFLFQGSYRWI